MGDAFKRTAVRYGAISFFTTILHNIFLLYHIEIFLSVYKIDKTSFWIGEVIFLLWNCVNDLLFGWLGDRHSLGVISEKDASAIIDKRILNLAYFGPLLAGSFLLFWVEWIVLPVQFAFSLCLYDAFLTMVDLNHSALLADLAITSEHRTTMNTYQSMFSALGSMSVFMSYRFWRNTKAFQFYCLTIAFVSAIGFYVTSISLRKSCTEVIRKEKNSLQSCSSVHTKTDISKMKSFLKQLATHDNFKYFAAVNIIQVFHCHFNSNFFPIFLDTLLGDYSTLFGSMLIGISFVLPHLNNIMFLILCRKIGVYAVMRYLFLIKLLLASVMLYAGIQHVWMMCLFIVSNRIFTEGTCKLLSLVISDLIDEDCVRNQRSEPISALIFGMANFLAKPGQTAAPLLGTALMSIVTGHDIYKTGLNQETMKSLTDDVQQLYRQASFHILVFTPIGCAILQLIAWKFYKLHGKQLAWVKGMRSNSLKMAVV